MEDLKESIPLDRALKQQVVNLSNELIQTKAALSDQVGTTANAVKIVEDLRKENALLRQHLDRIIDKLIEHSTRGSDDDD